MSVFISPFNVGKYFEAYFVCPEMHREYFENVCNILEADHAAKSAVFSYDSEPFSERIKANLKKSKNVVFILTSGAVEKAAAEDYDEFRQAYKFVWENNPHAPALMAVNNCHLGYDIVYPEDMESFKWLHRIKRDLNKITAEDMAHRLCHEFRLGYTEAKEKKLNKLAECSRAILNDMNYKAKRALSAALVCEIISGTIFALMFMTSVIEKTHMLISLLTLLAFISLPFVAVGYLSFAFAHTLYMRIKLYDVSVLFADFKIRSAKRISALIGIGMGVGISFGITKIVNYAEGLDDKAASMLVISIFIVSALFTAVQLIKVLMLSNIYGSVSSTFKERRRIHFIFTAIHLFLALILFIAILSNFPGL